MSGRAVDMVVEVIVVGGWFECKFPGVGAMVFGCLHKGCGGKTTPEVPTEINKSQFCSSCSTLSIPSRFSPKKTIFGFIMSLMPH